MEILNRNKRKRAFWRVFILGLLIAGATFAAVYNIHKLYKDQGSIALRECQDDSQLRIRTLEGQTKDQTVTINSLRRQLDDLKAASDNPDELMQLAAEREKAKDDEIKRLDRRGQELERSLNSCKGELAACTNF